ncbi:MAG: DUF756 domain-containing protein, partial [Sphingobacteriales bacterium]
LKQKINTAPGTEAELTRFRKELANKEKVLANARLVTEKYTDADFDQLTEREKNLHRKAFTTNKSDPDYRTVGPYRYTDGSEERTMNIPKGDVLHQFRTDVASGSLPAVSWIIGPENFSDHPGAPWYGAWYVSEVMDILTSKPEVWKKTIFILCYDENDGYFDHVPPFVPPNPYMEGTGMVSEGIDAKVEYVTVEQDMKRKPREECRDSPIGLGFRVPLVIASPWSRGGQVCSQVFDHTSILRFLEKFLSHKTGKKIREENISEWRRTVCGDLTAVFKSYANEQLPMPPVVVKNSFYETVHRAQFMKDPSGYIELSRNDIELAKKQRGALTVFQQEKGQKPACPLPYELYADGNFDHKTRQFAIRFAAKTNVFGKASAGSPFMVFSGRGHKAADGARVNNGNNAMDPMRVWNYAVKAGDELADNWNPRDFEERLYHLRVLGPNGFFREFSGDDEDPLIQVRLGYRIVKSVANGELELTVTNSGNSAYQLRLLDDTYHNVHKKMTVAPKSSATILIATLSSFGWYDVKLLADGHPKFSKQFAGHVETGKFSRTDPAM